MNHRGQIVYVVDDVSVCRSLSILLKEHGFRVETFTRAVDFLAFKHPKKPSTLVLDIRMPGMSGFALQEAMAARHLTIPIVFITSYGSILMSVKAMKAGAVDFLPKPFTEKKLLNAIDIAITKDKIQNKIQAEIDKINRDINTLSPRELEVFYFVVKGFVNKQIAIKRGTAIQTVKVHRGRVMLKMHAKTLTELTFFAHKAGILSPLINLPS
jgi:FixJ family two-component response regulator